MAVLAVSLVGLLGCGPGAADTGWPGAPQPCDLPTVSYTTIAPAGLVPSPEDLRGPAGLAVADVDGDGVEELILATMGGTVVLAWNGATFTVVRALPAAVGVAGADVDADGDVDLALATWSGSPDLILWNEGGEFVSEELPDATGQSTTPAFGDFDGDGRLDLWMARGWSSEGDLAEIIAEAPPGDLSSLYLWRGDHFEDASARIPAEGQGGYTFHAAPLDADADGDLDVWLSNDMGPFILPDLLLRNEGESGFVADLDTTLPHFGMGVAVGDVNGDAQPDLFLTDLGGPDLLVSDSGGWYDATLARGADLGEEPDRMVSWGARFVDVDGDGRDDIPVAFGRGDAAIQEDAQLVNPDWEIAEEQRDALLLATDAGFADVGDALGVATARHRGIVTLDLDGDQVPEVVAAGKSDLTVYRYGAGCPSRGTVYVYGDDVRPAIGARVTVRGERQTTRWVLPSATESASGNAVFVGMGHADTVEVDVRWLDGHEATFTLSAGQSVAAYP